MIFIGVQGILAHPENVHYSNYPNTKQFGRLTAKGEPHRREWQIDVIWDLRDSRVTGSATFKNKWLSGALRQLQTLEEEILNRKNGTGVVKANFRIYCNVKILQSVRSTATRYGIPFQLKT